MEKVLISACLLGQRVRFDGKDARADDELLVRWSEEGRLVPVCPEVAGGLPVPRPPAELKGGDGSDALDGRAAVIDEGGADVTPCFEGGAWAAVDLARRHSIRIAILKESSPSCGSRFVYDGSFSRARIPGQGVTAALLRRHGLRVFSEEELPAAAAFLRSLAPAG